MNCSIITNGVLNGTINGTVDCNNFIFRNTEPTFLGVLIPVTAIAVVVSLLSMAFWPRKEKECCNECGRELE